MKWGIRKYQNEDGTLTPEGKKRYGSKENLDQYRRIRNKRALSTAIGVAGAALGGYGISRAFGAKRGLSAAIGAGKVGLTTPRHLKENKRMLNQMASNPKIGSLISKAEKGYKREWDKTLKTSPKYKMYSATQQKHYDKMWGHDYDMMVYTGKYKTPSSKKEFAIKRKRHVKNMNRYPYEKDKG